MGGPSMEALGVNGLFPSLLSELPSSSPPEASSGTSAEPEWEIITEESQAKDLPAWWMPLLHHQPTPGSSIPWENFPLTATTPRGVLLLHIHVPGADSCMRSPSEPPCSG